MPETTSISHGPTNPSGPSNWVSARSISLHAAARAGASTPESIWCRAPKDEAALSAVDRAKDPLLAARILLELHVLRDLAGYRTTRLSVTEPHEVPVFLRRWDTGLLTVLSLMNRRAAICA